MESLKVGSETCCDGRFGDIGTDKKTAKQMSCMDDINS